MKLNYKNINFDSELEVNYFKLLEEKQKNGEIIRFIYHPKSIMISNKNKYTPDFIVVSTDEVKIVETKGYSQFSFMKDNLTHNLMLQKTEEELKEYVESNNVDTNNKRVSYQKIKYLKAYGFVDWDFKNPNTQLNKTRAKRDELEEELKECKKKLKDYERYIKNEVLLSCGGKLTKAQARFQDKFWKENVNKYLMENNYD